MLVISYNLRKHRAISELAALDERHEPDVLCLQECDTTDLAERVGGRLQLAHSTTGNRLGLAMYYRADRFEPRDIKAFALKKSLHDRVLRPAHERLLGGARLIDLEHDRREFIVASFHAAPPLTALNSLRRHQIRSALGELQFLGPGLPTLMVGDYNYPRLPDEPRREGAGRRVRADAQRQPHVHAVQVLPRALRSRDERGPRDAERAHTPPRGSSDHLPILVDAHYHREVTASVPEASTR